MLVLIWLNLLLIRFIFFTFLHLLNNQILLFDAVSQLFIAANGRLQKTLVYPGPTAAYVLQRSAGMTAFLVCQQIGYPVFVGLYVYDCRTPLLRAKCFWGTKIMATVPLLAYLRGPTATVPGSKASPSRRRSAASCSPVKRRATNRSGYNISTQSWALWCPRKSTQVRTSWNKCLNIYQFSPHSASSWKFRKDN